MLEVFDVFERFGREYFSNPKNKIMTSHRAAYHDILACRTGELGGHEAYCDSCFHSEMTYCSCNNRSCPKCNSEAAEEWADKRRNELLPVPYFHAVLTLPHQLNTLMYYNQRILYNVLCRVAGASVLELLEERKFVGGKGGLICVLHTWNRTLQYHPHVHLLIPGVAIDGDVLRYSRSSFLISTRKLARTFKEKFLKEARKALPNIVFGKKLEKLNWYTYIKDSENTPENVLQYLGRYIRRMAFTNSRLVSITNNDVSFRYKSSGETKWQVMTLSAQEFIGRFLMHVLPKGFHKVRYYGFFSPRGKEKLKSHFIPDSIQVEVPEEDEKTASDCIEYERRFTRNCVKCSKGKMYLGAFVPKKAVRAPP